MRPLKSVIAYTLSLSEGESLGTTGTLSVLDVELGAVLIFSGANVVIVKVVQVMIVATFADFILVPYVA